MDLVARLLSPPSLAGRGESRSVMMRHASVCAPLFEFKAASIL